MLNKVSSALAKFIAPVASSKISSDTGSPHQNGGSFKRYQPEKEKSDPQLRLVKPNDGEAPSGQHLPAVAIKNLSVAHAFIQLFNKLKEQRGKISRWVGAHTYQTAAKRQKRAGKVRKGTMLDEKIG
ncbi:MAG: hypothetical protein AB7P04_01955 [Bacteriovoracia bacterium]